jgi:hypothetical protein
MKKVYLLLPLIFIFIGCSGKSQINPNPEKFNSGFSKESYFYDKKNQNKALEDSFNRGKDQGYENAKKEFEKIIPYLEAIRASAELSKSGGLCYGPLFLDKSDSSGVKVLLGDAHICDNFTVDRILKIVKSGIPGLPEYATKTNEQQVNMIPSSTNNVSSVEIAGMKEQDFFIEKPEVQKAPVKVKIKDTFTNRQILRETNNSFSSVELDATDKNYMILEFTNSENMNNFCNKFNICIKG